MTDAAKQHGLEALLVVSAHRRGGHLLHTCGLFSQSAESGTAVDTPVGRRSFLIGTTYFVT